MTPCRCCGDLPASWNPDHGWVCADCETELVTGQIPGPARITGRRANMPAGMSITRHGAKPGTGHGGSDGGRGTDYFGDGK